MYRFRFLLTPRWLGLVALMLTMAAVMVYLGNWQLDRYHSRAAINARIDAAASGTAASVAEVLPAPGAPGRSGTAPPAAAAWRRITATGRYDQANEILVRGRTVNDQVGFEVVTPLVLADGSALLVDRGWVPPAAGGAIAQPDAPRAPAGQIRVTGRIHLSESRPGPLDRRNGWIEVRRIHVSQLAEQLPYPTYGAYLLMDQQTPAADERLVPVPVAHENSWQNAGYVVQWWMFAGLTLAGLIWIVRREIRDRAGLTTGTDRLEGPTPPPEDRGPARRRRPPAGTDRLAEHDSRAGG